VKIRLINAVYTNILINRKKEKNMDTAIKKITVPKDVRKKTNFLAAQFYDELEIFSSKMVGYNNGHSEGTWYFKDYTNVLIENANLNSQFARIVFVTAAAGHKKDVLISMTTNFNIQGDINKILFCSGMFSYKNANNFAKEVFDVLYKAFTDYKDNGEPSLSNVGISSAEELKKYSELFKEGIISEEEYNAKKKQLLGL